MSRRSDLAIAWLWLRSRFRLMTRTPRATFFTFVFPLILLVLLDSLGTGEVSVPGGKVPYGQYITPAIAIFALTAATYTFIIFGVATAREHVSSSVCAARRCRWGSFSAPGWRRRCSPRSPLSP